MKKLFFLIFLLSTTLSFAQDFDERDDSSFDEEYSLYERNRHGLDWNQFNFPETQGKRR